jgi:small subunit ribosomal protein S17
MPKRILKGQVVNNTADKTVNVLVNTRVLHPIYKKYINSSKKFLAHDEQNKFIVGDIIKIQESKPLSKRKTWVALEKIERS